MTKNINEINPMGQTKIENTLKAIRRREYMVVLIAQDILVSNLHSTMKVFFDWVRLENPLQSRGSGNQPLVLRIESLSQK